MAFSSARLPGAFALALALLSGFAPSPTNAHDKLGANLNFIGDFRRNHEFVDLVKQSRRFLRVGQFDDQQTANLAPLGLDGWPTTDFRVFAMAAQQNTLGLAGTYKIVFTGQAALSTQGGGAGSIVNQVHDAATNTTRADLVFPAGAENFMVDFTATGGSVKDVRILRPGYDSATAPLLHDPWKAHVQRFTVLRFLDWTRTNGNRAVTWADRTTPEKLRTEAYIARWETVIDAANALGRDAWINVPVQANNEYVTNLATLLRDRLAPTLNVYVEYGNELWNFAIRDVDMDAINGGAFNGATVNRDLAVASPSGSPLRFDATTDPNVLAFRRVALRLKEVSDIFKAVWGSAAINTRVRPILAGQMANGFIVSEGLRLVDEGLAVRPDTVFYGLSGAPYIFASAAPDGNADEAPGLTSQQILAGLAAGVANAPSESAYQYLTHAGLGAWYGLKVVAYEAGFDSFGSANVAAKRAANLDPALRQTCKALIDQWHAFGFEHLLWFNAGADTYDTQFGMWPLVEDMGVPATPKNQCMDDVLAAALPAVTAGTAVTGAAIAGGNHRGSTAPASTLTGGASQFGFPGFVEYLLRADTAGTYDLVFRGTAPPGESFRLKLNNALVAAAVAPPASLGNVSAPRVSLRKGLNAMRIERNGSGASWSVESFSFTLFAPATPLVASPESLAFGGQSMGTTSAPRTVTVTNTGATALTISAVSVSSSQFAQTNDCTSVAPSAACTITLTFSPASVAGGLNSTAAVTGMLTITSSIGSPTTVSLAGSAEKSLVTHYYRAILNRAPDSAGKSFWESEAARLSALGVNTNETWFVMAGYFFNSAEYLAAGKNDTQFVTDLYNTFFNRGPDAGGLTYWVGQIQGGLPREVALFSFMFSNEFRTFTQGIFGNTAARPEVDMVVDFFRGLLNRLPDTPSFNFWLGRLRTAQCQGAGPVFTAVGDISAAFMFNPEYDNRQRTNTQFVTDMYYSFLRRGGDSGGVQYWINELNTGARFRNDVRLFGFLNSSEFGARVQAVIAAGCAP